MQNYTRQSNSEHPAPPTPPPLYGEQPKPKKGKGCLFWGLIGIGVFVVGILFLGFIGSSGAKAFSGSLASVEQIDRKLVYGDKFASGDKWLAIVDLEGVIMDNEETLQLLAYVREEEKCSGLLLRIDSGGGGVTASDEIWHAVRQVKGAGKPVVVYMGSMAASGGYYIAAAADWIVANPTTITGSIGVIIQTPAYKEALNKLGIEMRTFTSGKNKAILSPTEEMSDEQRQIIQDLVNVSYDRFVGIVASGRNLDENELRNGIADGRILSAEQALEHKLIDQIGYSDDATLLALEAAGLPNGAPVYLLEKQIGLKDLFGSPFGKVEVEVEGVPNFTTELQSGVPYYIAPHQL